MNRSKRIYWLFAVLMFIFSISVAADGIREKKHQEEQNIIKESQTEITTEINTELTSVEGETEETTEGTTISPEEKTQKVSEFYSGQVFLGDSIMSGLSFYASKKEAPSWLNNVIFLSKTSWKVGDVLTDKNGPLYKGKSQSVTTTLTEIQPQKIFICLGINEMSGLGSPGYSVEKLVNKYADMISGIKSAVPQSKIYIISITPCTAEKDNPMFSNAIIDEYNQNIKSKSSEWGVQFIDLAAEFDGVLAPEYSSDGVHHTDASYREVWIPFFEEYALNNQ